MWSIIKKVMLGLVVVIVLLVAASAIFVYREANREIEPHFAGQCEIMPLDGSSEDLQVDRERGFAYLSLFDRSGGMSGEDVAQGTIARIDLNAEVPVATSALISSPDRLHPHGLSLFIDADGQRYIFVVNHPEDRENGEEAVESFREIEPGRFAHVETFKNALLTHPNDLVAVGPREFYVAIDTGPRRDGKPTNLLHFRGDDVYIITDDIESGGGINASADGRYVYVSETDAKAIRVFGRDPADGKLTAIRRIELESAPDNIDIADDGSLVVGTHSNTMALVLHFMAGSDSPSQVLQISTDAAGNDTIEEIYLNRGEEISAGSVGATYNDLLIIGSITARKILLCRYDS
ncbi:MAG: beta-propeller fold lactonase family protein [Gammaproteobacteria bacterium]|jgi:arylesterase/paraoxonase|nr:beta-propeller fold lactonase family protein [Gammaproteobacteria bacterium]